MADKLHLALLGGLHVRHGTTPVTGFVSGKAVALLCYLAVTARPHFRAALAARFWRDMPEANARMNLRHVLANLRHVVGSHLVITRDTVAFNRAQPYVLDVEQFETLVRQAVPGNIDHLHAAIRHYQGDFLEGFSVRDAPEFDEWMVTEGERLRQLALHALHEAVAYHTVHQHYSTGIDYAARMLQLDPWREEAHRQLMLLLAHSGQPSAALQQYDACCRILDTELGVEPDEATTALRDQIHAGEIAARPSVVARHHVPFPPTALVGRAAEQAAIAQLLQQPAVRLLTLVGPGGVGKTHLALVVAAQQRARFADGVFAVDLAPLRGSGCAAAAIAHALQLADDAHQPVLERAQRWIGDRQMLILLDNVDQLREAAVAVSTLLAACPHLKLVVTSRASLHLRGEHVFPIEPLAVPPPPALRAHHNNQAADLAQYPAVNLFTQHALSVQPRFTLTDENAPVVAEICARLDGLPLAIELAAARTKLLSLPAILALLDNRLQLLTNGAHDRPARHQTLRDAISWSYDLLQADEQALFRRLGMFTNSFTLQAAQHVWVIGADSGTTLPSISVLRGMEALIDKSLLRRVPAEHDADLLGAEPRFAMLQTIREYALERLVEAGEADAVKQQHDHFSVALLKSVRNTSQQRAWRTLFDADDHQDNIALAEHGALMAD